jgi:PTS system fructose-specific IIA component
MKLSQLLTNKAILLDFKDIDNKWDLISRLTDILVETEQISAGVREPIHQALVTREKSMSTGMENGIAIPHCCVDLINETVVSLGISKAGIDFDSIDNKPTHLIILLVTPKNKTKMHIETLAEIAKLLNHEASKKLLLEARTPKQILEIIREEEKKDFMA